MLGFCMTGYGKESEYINTEARRWLSSKSQNGFLENHGQMTDMDGNPVPFVLYKTESPGLIFWITQQGVIIETLKTEEENAEREAEADENKIPGRKDENRKIYWGRIDIELKDASIKKNNIVKENAFPHYNNYFLPHCPDGIFGVQEYGKVTIKEAYPGIDWVFNRKPDGTLEHNFVVHPGADYNRIELLYKSKSPLKVNERGELELFSAYGNVKENTPVSFYEGKKIATKFVKQNERAVRLNGENGFETSVKFQLAFPQGSNPDFSSPLVIDPQLTWATFYGGSNAWEGAMAIKTDSVGNVFISGYTDRKSTRLNSSHRT